MRVLVSGYYGFGNLGDEALLAGLLGGLPGTQVTVLSRRPEATRALHGAGAAHRLTGLGALGTHDVLVSGGGGLLQDKTSLRSLRYYCGVINLAKRLRKRVVVYGQSVGPLTPTGARLVARTLRGVAVAVRDRPSQARLADLGVPAALVADAALALPRPLARPAAGTTEAPVLLVPRGGFPEVTAALVALARRLEAEGVALAGLALQPGEDARPLEGLARAVPALRPLAATTPEGALAHVAGSRYVVSARLHGLVFAALAERPASGVAYDPKVLAFGAEAGFPVHPLAADPEALRADVFHPRFRRLKVDALVARAQNGLAWLRRELER